ncbi:hypothetical protein Tco_1181331, partial [Tanacetum coccineum]
MNTKELMEGVNDMAQTMANEYVIGMSDFNVTLKTMEHYAGGSTVTNDMQDFIDCYVPTGAKGEEIKETFEQNELEKMALKRYNEAVDDEEKLLFQKAKVDRMSKGYRNNKYFHKVLKSTSHYNKIVSICDEEDDLLVLCHADVSSIKVVKEALMEFSKASGLLPNMSKSTMLFGNVKTDEANKILEVLSYRVGKLPVKYLGVPLITKKIGAKECKQLIDKLIASVLASMYVYWVDVFLLTKTVIKDIDKILKGFLWSKGELKRGKEKVALETVCTPKSQGGL